MFLFVLILAAPALAGGAWWLATGQWRAPAGPADGVGRAGGTPAGTRGGGRHGSSPAAGSSLSKETQAGREKAAADYAAFKARAFENRE